MRRATTWGLVAAALGALSCSAEAPVEVAGPDETVEPASAVALQIEQAQRSLDRGADGRVAASALEAALLDPGISAEQRRQAVLALSRAHEASEQTESAIAVIEAEMAAHADDRAWDDGPFERRLRELLTGTASAPGIDIERDEAVAPFAHVVAESFTEDAAGTVKATFFMAGGDSSLSDELGTFNIRGALKKDREKACPLCDNQVRVSRWVRQGDWTIIAEQQHRFDDAFVVFYFDLSRNRIPERYEHHLPMPVADVVAELEQGRSFVLAAERPAAPPVLLIAAPRTAMLEDVERHLAGLEQLPTTLEYAEVSTKLRPDEIRSVVRRQWFPNARGCYERLLERDAQAQGKIIIRFAIVGDDGATEAVRLETDAPSFQDDEFLRCIEASAVKMRFPVTGQGKARTTVAYPVHFTP